MSEISKHLRDVEIRFRSFADTTPAMIRMSGADKLCDFVNKGWLRFTGRTLEQEIGYGWIESIHPEDLEQCRATYLDAFELRRAFRMKYRLRRHDGQYRWILDDCTPRYTANGIFAGYIGAGMDVHEDREAEQQLRDLLVEKDRLLAIRETPMQEVRLRINNSLQLVSSFLLLQSAKAGDPRVAEEFQSCLVRIHSIGLVHDLLYSTESPGIELSDYLEVLCSRLIEALDDAERIRLRLDVEAVILNAETVIQVALIVTEVLTHALKHAFPDGRRGVLSLSFHRDGGRGILSIVDDGIGYHAKIESAGAYGLELIRILAARIKGTARHLQTGAGSRFHLEFPLPRSGVDRPAP